MGCGCKATTTTTQNVNSVVRENKPVNSNAVQELISKFLRKNGDKKK